MAVKADITATDNWFISEDKILEFSVVNDSGSAVNITGWALTWVLRRFPGSTALLTKTTANDVTITDGSGGICQVVITDAETETVGSGEFHHALSRTDSGNEAVLSYGTVTLRTS